MEVRPRRQSEDYQLHTRPNTSTGGHAVGMGDCGVDGASCAYRDTQKAPVAFDY